MLLPARGSVADPAREVGAEYIKRTSQAFQLGIRPGIVNASLDNASLGLTGTFVRERGGGYKPAAVYTNAPQKAGSVSYNAAEARK
jgi:hypothetical protein